MGKILNLIIEEYTIGFFNDTIRQEINCEEANISFYVQDLTECPEDATVYRDLFNAVDYIEALKKGIELAKMGYTDINFITKEERTIYD